MLNTVKSANQLLGFPSDARLLIINADDFGHDLVAYRQHILGLLDSIFGNLADVDKAFDAILEPREGAETDELGHFDFDV